MTASLWTYGPKLRTRLFVCVVPFCNGGALDRVQGEQKQCLAGPTVGSSM